MGTSSPQEIAAIQGRPATGAEVIAWMDSPPMVEQRLEYLMSMADRIGIDAARRIVDTLRDKEKAVYSLFLDEIMPVQSRAHVEALVSWWVAHNEDFDVMMEEQALRRAQEPAPVTPQEPEAPQHEAEESVPPPELRLGAHLVSLEEDRSLNGIDEATDSFFSYAKFRLPGQQ